MHDLARHALDAVIERLHETKKLGDGVLAQVSAPQLFWRSDAQANSIAIIVQHMHGNMRSRWTDFLTTDGEKPWRGRDGEFEPACDTPQDVAALWDAGWKLTFEVIGALQPADLTRTVHIRAQPLSVLQALIRQVGHYSYHVGQMVTLARQQVGPQWRSLSIPKRVTKP